MALPTFTLTAGPEGFSRVFGESYAIDTESLEGLEVTFTSNILAGQLLLADDGLRWVEPVVVTLDADGKINGDDGVELLANDSELHLEDDSPLEWTISFDQKFRLEGFRRQFTSWTFIAPDAGTTKGLDELSHVTGVSATNVTRGLRGYTPWFVLDDVEGDIQMVQAMDPEGTVGDPTWLPLYELGSIDGGTPASTGDTTADGGTP